MRRTSLCKELLETRGASFFPAPLAIFRSGRQGKPATRSRNSPPAAAMVPQHAPTRSIPTRWRGSSKARRNEWSSTGATFRNSRPGIPIPPRPTCLTTRGLRSRAPKLTSWLRTSLSTSISPSPRTVEWSARSERQLPSGRTGPNLKTSRLRRSNFPRKAFSHSAKNRPFAPARSRLLLVLRLSTAPLPRRSGGGNSTKARAIRPLNR